MDDNLNLLTRRSVLKRAAALFGGGLTATQLSLLTSSVAAMTEDSSPRFLNQEQFSMIKRIVDLIIPQTDTPGALGAGVHHFIDLMLAEWASPQRRARYVAGLEGIDRRARDAGADGFTAASSARQTTLLLALDKESFSENVSDGFFSELKKMVLFGYYSSEDGATVELQFQRIPGDYLPCVALDDNGRAWFWNGFSYGL